MMKTMKLIFAGAMLLYFGLTHPYSADADVDININIGPPPVYTIPAPPEVVVIPGAYVYFVPDIDVDIFFYRDYWYRPHKGYWYRAANYNGPWVYIVRERVPVVFLNLPPDYRRIPPGHNRIPYGHLKKNWRDWEKKRHWDEDRGEHKQKGKGKHR